MSSMLARLFTALLCLCGFFGFAQQHTLQGRIIDQNGLPVPFASVYLKEQKLTSVANENGYYNLRLDEGKYTLSISYVGYKFREVGVQLNSNATINIRLEPEIFSLREVAITTSGEDPAYRIVRETIKRRVDFRNEDSLFVCDLYTRGVQKLVHTPKRILGKEVAPVLGLDSSGQTILYQSETRSKLYSRGSDKKEVMIASKVAGDQQGYSFNSGLDLQLNFYNNLLHWDALGKSNFVSPVADNALAFYTYKLIGSSNVKGRIIHKIKVTPSHGHSPAFYGYIYVVDDDWHLYSVDLSLTDDARINFVDTLQISQQFIEVEKNIWKQSDISIRFKGLVLGFRFAGYVNGLNSNYDLNPQISKHFFGNEIMKIPPEINQYKEDYWVRNRPSPLTQEEAVNYYWRDSVEARKNHSRAFLDSIQREQNKFRIVPFVLVGYRSENLVDHSKIFVYPLHYMVFYNTVEGWGFNFKARYTKPYSLRRSIEIEPTIRYGFANKVWNTNGSITYKFDTLHHASFMARAGSDFLDLNNRGTINLFYNTLTTLFDGRNYLKLYRSKFLSFRTQRELVDGLQITTGVELARRYPVNNAPNQPIFDNAAGMLTSNNPLIPDKDEDLFPINNAFVVEAKASYTYGQKYATRPDGKVYQPPRYPTIQLDYRKGINNVFNSKVDYDFLSADIFQDKIKTGLTGYSSFYLSAGKFLNDRSLYFPDIHHFTGNQTAIYNPIFPNFHFLDYYRFSTTDKYFEGHYEHNFAGFITRKVPLMRNLKLEEIMGGAYLTVPGRNYKEVYFGFQRLLLRADYGWSWAPGEKPKPAFRLFYGF